MLFKRKYKRALKFMLSMFVCGVLYAMASEIAKYCSLPGISKYCTLPGSGKYCNPSYSRDMGNEGLVSRDYKLLNVHVLIRHGISAPIRRLPNGTSDHLTCLTDSTLHSQHPKVRSYVDVMASSAQKMPRDAHFNRWALYPTHRKCSEGQLTGLGAVQHIVNGKFYNDRYSHLHRLFDETNWHNNVVAHTTQLSRTFQSAVAFLYGLLPSFDLEKINLKGSSSVNFCDEGLDDSVCTCLGVESFCSKASRECRLDQNYVYITKRYKDAIDHIKTVLNIQPNELLHYAALLDGLRSYACHNVPWPCNPQGICITTKTLKSLWELAEYQSTCLKKNKNYRKYAKFVMHGFLQRIAQEMNFAKASKTYQIFHLYSSHDSTFFPVIVALELDNVILPDYASRLVFELYQQIATNEHFIRVLQNGNIVTSETVFCRNKTKHGFCHFEYFYNHTSASLNRESFCNYVRFTSSLRSDR